MLTRAVEDHIQFFVSRHASMLSVARDALSGDATRPMRKTPVTRFLMLDRLVKSE